MAEFTELKIKAEFSNEMLEQIRQVVREELAAQRKEMVEEVKRSLARDFRVSGNVRRDV